MEKPNDMKSETPKPKITQAQALEIIRSGGDFSIYQVEWDEYCDNDDDRRLLEKHGIKIPRSPWYWDEWNDEIEYGGGRKF
jgi:hypothetical protein